MIFSSVVPVAASQMQVAAAAAAATGQPLLGNLFIYNYILIIKFSYFHYILLSRLYNN